MPSSAEAVRPVEPHTVGDLVTAELRRAILSGALPHGQSFSLRELAGMLEVSFIPVREALRSLESEGLMIIRPGRTAMVAPIDLEDLHAIYRLRRLIEPDLARRSCTLLADAELVRLEGEAAAFGDPELSMDAIYDAHLQFHLALFAPAATAWDTRVLTTLWRAAERYIRLGFGLLDPDPEEHRRRHEAHRSLLSVYKDRDPTAVAKAVDEHLDHNERIARSALATVTGPDSERAHDHDE